jgi:DNA-directed RNA polymerase
MSKILHTPEQWLLISAANQYGLDKEVFSDRLTFMYENHELLEKAVPLASEPLLYEQSIREMRKLDRGEASGVMVRLDSTASGIQIMGCLMDCMKTAKWTNLTDPGVRYDAYTDLTKIIISKAPNSPLLQGRELKDIRKDVKQAIMTHFYNGRKIVSDVFGGDNELMKAFYDTMQEELPGASKVLALINMAFNGRRDSFMWTLPDGHQAKVFAKTKKEVRIETQELPTNFVFRTEVNEANDNYRHLAPNIIHSIDAWVVREMVKRGHKQGFQVVTVHDEFACHPRYAELMYNNYKDIMIELAESKLLAKILTELTGKEYNQSSHKGLVAQAIRDNYEFYGLS